MRRPWAIQANILTPAASILRCTVEGSGRCGSMQGSATSENTNSRFKFLLNQGQTGLSLALDLPTQLGLDSDDPLAKDDVGKLGVAIDTLRDMEEIFDGIPLDKISTSFTINSTASILLAMYVATAEKQGVDPERAAGNHSKRYHQGVHRPGDLHLSSRAFDPAHRRHH